MRLADIIFAIQQDISGGRTGMANIIPASYIKKTLNSYRATWIEADFLRQSPPRRLNPSCYQRYYLQFNQALQVSAPTGAVIFTIPQFIGLDRDDGIRYAGSLGGIDTGQPLSQWVCINRWRRLYNRGQLYTINSNSLTKLSNNLCTIYYLPDFTNGYLEVYNCPQLTEGMIEGVLSDPLQSQLFNEYTDDYPIDINSLESIREAIYKDRTEILKSVHSDLDMNIPTEHVALPPRQVVQTKPPTQ